MKKIGRQSISIFALALVVLMTGCSKDYDDKAYSSKGTDVNYSDSMNTNPEDDKRLESYIADSSTIYTEELDDTFSVIPEVTNDVTPNGSTNYSDVVYSVDNSDSLLEDVSDDVTYNYDISDFEEIPDELYDFEGPCVLLDPENAHFEEIPNDDYDNQVNLVRDLVSLDEVDTTFSFFDDYHNKDDLATTYSIYVKQLEYLVSHTTPEEIVRELNNLFILSQTPSCMADEAWEFYFGTLDKLKNHPYDAFYEVYIDLANFVHDVALKNNVSLKLVQEN